ncbi:MAG TPA: hypothetical protein VII06_34805 [Chloroflexota bacterium]|jgi:hypothetical protein
MSDLHWTGAVVLLALAVLGTDRVTAPRDPCVSWAEFLGRRPLDRMGRPSEDEQEGV